MLNCWWEMSSATEVGAEGAGEPPSAPRHDETPLKSNLGPFYAAGEPLSIERTPPNSTTASNSYQLKHLKAHWIADGFIYGKSFIFSCIFFKTSSRNSTLKETHSPKRPHPADASSLSFGRIGEQRTTCQGLVASSLISPAR